MKDRRKNFYCGPQHKIQPLETLAGILLQVQNECKDVNGLNYGGKIKLIESLSFSGACEVDKLILKDNERVEDADKNIKR